MSQTKIRKSTNCESPSSQWYPDLDKYLIDYQSFPQTFSAQQVQVHQKLIFVSIEQLYGEYLNDFMTRKQNRLASKHPLESQPRYTLQVDRSFRRKLRDHFSRLARTEMRDQMVEQFTECVKKFIQDLAQELRGFKRKSRLLQAIFVSQAFYTMKNAAEQIQKITFPIFRKSNLKCRQLNSKLFYQKIMKNYSKLLQYAHQEGIRCDQLSELLDIQDELLGVENEERFEYFSQSSDQDENKQENLQKMSVEELVTFINSEEGQQKRSAKRRKQVKVQQEEDVEVEEFRKRLDQWIFPSQRLRPWISQDYIEALRSSLIRQK